MAIVFIPSQWRDLTDQQTTVTIDAENLRQLIQLLDQRYPGIHTRLCVDGAVRPSIQIACDGQVTTRNLSTPIQPQTEVHFLPAIGGG